MVCQRSSTPVHVASAIVGDSWSVLILREALLLGACRFVDFADALQLNRSTLTDRLSSLTASGLLKGVRVDYVGPVRVSVDGSGAAATGSYDTSDPPIPVVVVSQPPFGPSMKHPTVVLGETLRVEQRMIRSDLAPELVQVLRPACAPSRSEPFTMAQEMKGARRSGAEDARHARLR